MITVLLGLDRQLSLPGGMTQSIVFKYGNVKVLLLHCKSNVSLIRYARLSQFKRILPNQQ